MNMHTRPRRAPRGAAALGAMLLLIHATGCAKPRPSICRAGALSRIRATLGQLRSYESLATPLPAGQLAKGKAGFSARIAKLPVLVVADGELALRLPVKTSEPRWRLQPAEKIEGWPGTRQVTARLTKLREAQTTPLGKKALHLAIHPKTPASDLQTLLKVLKDVGYEQALLWLQAAAPPKPPTVPRPKFLTKLSDLLDPPLGEIPSQVGPKSAKLVDAGPQLLGRIVKRLQRWAEDRCPAAADVLEDAEEKSGFARLDHLAAKLPAAIVKCGCHGQKRLLSGLLWVTAVPRVHVKVRRVTLDPLSGEKNKATPQAQWQEIVRQVLAAGDGASFWIHLP